MEHTAIIGLTIPALAGCISAIFLSLWYHDRDDRGTLCFAGAFLCYALGFTANHFILDKDTLANAFVHNAFYAGGLYLLLDGIHIAFGRKTPVVTLTTIGIGSVIGAVIIQVSPIELSQRILWINTLQGCMFIISAVTLWGIWARNWTGTATYAAIALCLVNTMTLVPYNILRSQITEETFFHTLYWEAMNVISTLSMLVMAAALVATCVVKRVESLREDAGRDFLTGLKNRRAFEEAAQLYCQTRSGEVAASLILIDIDNFKQINDEHGHAAGDEVISQFGKFLRTQTRTSDMAGRMGGEEFCLLLPGTDTRGARQLATRLRTRLSAQAFANLPGSHTVTASFGIAELGRQTVFADAYPMADAALYAAKTRGRDRAVCAPPPDDAGEPIRREVYRTRPDGSRVAASRMAS